MKTILIMDTETSGINHQKDRVLEIAGILYDIDSRSIIQQVSTLIYTEENAAEHINHICVDSLKASKMQVEIASIELLKQMWHEADAIVAHNASFDRNFCKQWPMVNLFSETKKWVCSKSDITWPKTSDLKLTTIATAMGVDNLSAHRALADCLMLAQCFAKLPDLKEQLMSSAHKNIYKANVSYEDKHLPKEAGFYWNHDMRRWEKKMTDEQATLINFSISKI
jgi:DNA polymerase-3 subunit epsilon